MTSSSARAIHFRDEVPPAFRFHRQAIHLIHMTYNHVAGASGGLNGGVEQRMHVLELWMPRTTYSISTVRSFIVAGSHLSRIDAGSRFESSVPLGLIRNCGTIRTRSLSWSETR